MLLLEGSDNRVRALCLHADDLNARVDLLGARRNAGNQSTAARGNENHVNCRQIGQNFECNRTLSCHDVLIIKGMDELCALFFNDFARFGIGFIVNRAMQHDLCAIALGCGNLGNRCRARHDDGGGYADLGRCECNALRMVAC